MRILSTVGALTLVANITIGTPGFAQDEAARLLTLPLTPGSVAALVAYAREAEVQARLSDALKDPNPAVRAMAARVAFVTHASTLVPVIGSLLPSEADPEVAGEMIRVVGTFGAPDALPVAEAAAARLESAARAALLETYARSHPDRLGGFAGSGTRNESLEAFVLACTQHPEVAPALANVARERGESYWGGFLTTMHGVMAPVDSGALSAGLEGSDAGVRERTARYVAELAGHPADRLDTTVVARAADGAEADGALTWERAYREVARRALKRDAHPIAWAALLEPLSPSDRNSYLAAINASLFGPERPAVERLAGRKLDGDEVYLSAAGHDLPAQFIQKTRLVPAFVAAYLESIMQTTGCTMPPGDPLVVAELAYGPDGRPRAIRPTPARVSGECVAASNIVFQVTVASRRQAIVPGSSDGVVLPFSREFLACALRPSEPPLMPPFKGNLRPPKPLKPFNPEYPSALKAQAIAGRVEVRLEVTSTGCARDAETVASLHPLLDFEALRLVYGTKWEPASVDGQPKTMNVATSVSFRP